MELKAAETAAALHFETLDTTITDRREYEMALKHAPVILFDVREPFLPSVIGYTVFRQDGRSPSFPRDITMPPGVVCAIEYAVWWDWEIQHLYELEHIWVYVGADDQVVAVDASWHGGFHVMTGADGNPPLDDGRAVVFSESGKHAFAPVIDWMMERKPTTDNSCGRSSGRMGVHVTPLFEGVIDDRGWYYVKSDYERFLWRAPVETDREVVAVSFTETGVVENIERFGLENGRVVALNRRVTTSNTRGVGFLRQLFSNLGNIDAGQFLGGGSRDSN